MTTLGYHHRAVILLLSLGLCLMACHASAFPLQPDRNHQDIPQAIVFLEDPQHQLTLDAVRKLPAERWQRNDDSIFNQGYSESTWWLRVTLQNPTTQRVSRLLEISYPVLDFISVAVFHQAAGTTERLPGKHLTLGDKQPFHQRPVDHRNFVVPLSWQPEETLVLYLAVRSSSSIQVPIALWHELTFFSNDRTQSMMHGIYYGIMFVMILYNLFVYLAVGDRNYLYYVMFVFCLPLFLASLNGFAFQYLWPGHTEWNDQAILVFLSGTVFFGFLFTYHFLDVPLGKNGLGWIGVIAMLVAALLMVLALVLPYSLVIRLLVPFAAGCCLIGVSLGVYRWYSGGLSARYYTIAWSALLMGGVILALNKVNYLPKNFFTEYATQIGSALEVILLSFALAERINQERKMRFAAQQEALITERELRQAQEHALEVQKQATESLELRVHERTRELQELNRKLAELSDTDQLTGLKNRRYLDRVLSEELVRSARYRHHLAVLLMDIDHFKAFNDTYGHLVGDDCLREVGQCICDGMRWPSDRAARYGGEEFCVVLPETDIQGAMKVAERIRQNVEVLGFLVKGEPVPVTISIGVTCLVPAPELTIEALLAQADQALYLSKKAGRNCVTLYRSTDEANREQSDQDEDV